jgi:hypothetical protein
MPMHASALFADRHSAHAAVEQLAQAGFARDEVTVAMSEATHEREFGTTAGRSPSARTISGIRQAPYSGGVLPAIVSTLKPFESDEGAPLRVGGPLLEPLLRARSLAAALGGLGMQPDEARAIHEGLLGGQIVVGVHTAEGRVDLARQLLKLAGGETTQAA